MTSQPLQHNLASVLRAVENGVPVLLVSNTGPSEVIDAHGRVMARAGRLFEPAVVESRVAPASGGTFYTYFGDVFVVLMLAVVLVGLWPVFSKGLRLARLGVDTGAGEDGA
jgi:apolipoprotein N-acyltransferase